MQDEWFKPYRGFHARETRFNVVSIIKGEWSGDKLVFRHSQLMRGYLYIRKNHYHIRHEYRNRQFIFYRKLLLLEYW